MCSIRLPNPVVIFELLQKASAHALIYEASLGFDLSESPVPTYPTIQVSDQDAPDLVLPPLQTDYSASDLVFIFHTSGSTGGRPKLVPYNRRLLDHIVSNAEQAARVLSIQGQDVTVAM